MFEVTELKSKNKLIQMLSSSCNHEMLAPIRCIISMTESLLTKFKESAESFDLKIIFNTASFLLNQV